MKKRPKTETTIQGLNLDTVKVFTSTFKCLSENLKELLSQLAALWPNKGALKHVCNVVHVPTSFDWSGV